MLQFGEITDGIQACELNVSLLYSDPDDRARFERNWPEYEGSDPSLARVMRRTGNKIFYDTESLIPARRDNRPPLLLLLGNPAAHSVDARMCFASEGSEREHRFWTALRHAGLLEFSSDSQTRSCALEERNRIRKQELFQLDYASPFRIGIAVYFSLPSPASDPKWSGVSGLRRLFGARALRLIAARENERISDLMRVFMDRPGGIIAFHRDAYEGVRSASTPPYALKAALNGRLLGQARYGAHILLAGAPPTRLLRSATALQSLARCREHLAVSLQAMSGH